MISLKMGGIIVAAFVAGAFIASPELRAYAANSVFSTDIVDGEVKTADLANNAVTAAKVKDGEIKAAEIATDAVGAAELQGVTKLLFGRCKVDSTEGTTNILAGSAINVACSITGVDTDDSAIAAMNSGNSCFEVRRVDTLTNLVRILLLNDCPTTQQLGTGAEISIMVYDK